MAPTSIAPVQAARQQTIAAPLWFAGVGLHSGRRVAMRILPAPTNYGIVFRRNDVAGDAGYIAATWDNVVDTALCTTLGNRQDMRISTVEHLMAALRAAQIDNALIELNQGEVPILDGSSASFLEAFSSIGVRTQAANRRVLKILHPVQVHDGDSWARLEPCPRQIHAATIDFPHPVIGRQSFAIDVDAGEFDVVSNARTFGMEADVARLQQAGLALGGSLRNAVLVGTHGVVNEEGLHSPDEFVRHKVLDSVGDMYLAGAPIRGRFVGYKSGHALHCELLQELFSRPLAMEFTTAASTRQRRNHAQTWTKMLRPFSRTSQHHH